MTGKILSINISDKKGEKKKPVGEVLLVENTGIRGDAHAGTNRQVSLLALESVLKMGGNFKPGDFAENLTTEGVDLLSLPIGSQIKIGKEVVLEISQHGKTCHDRCEIFRQHGSCVMPKEGVFAKVIKGGIIKKGNTIELIPNCMSSPRRRGSPALKSGGSLPEFTLECFDRGQE